MDAKRVPMAGRMVERAVHDIQMACNASSEVARGFMVGSDASVGQLSIAFRCVGHKFEIQTVTTSASAEEA